MRENKMNCHLIEQARARQLTADTIQSEVAWTDSIFESDLFNVGIVKCRTCGQDFLYCFKQYTSMDGEDDYWTFWIPAKDGAIHDAKSAMHLLKFMGELVHECPHICWHPDGHVFWAEKGCPLAFIIFLP